MALRVDPYSRMVAWLKIILPLTALAILSTVFLLSRSIDPTTTIPFADGDVQDRVRDQQITGPFFSGTTPAGDQINFTASIVRPAQGENSANEVQDLTAWLDLQSGARIVLKAKTGTIDIPKNEAIFTGDVMLETSSGYMIDSEQLISALSELSVFSPQRVNGYGPFGDITAGQMQLQTDPEKQSTHLVFTNGVKLIYDPKQIER